VNCQIEYYSSHTLRALNDKDNQLGCWPLSQPPTDRHFQEVFLCCKGAPGESQ